jgi:hypothetical protein
MARNPISTLPATPRVRRTRRHAPASATPPAGLTLVSATYDPGAAVDLVFDRAVDIAGFDAGSVAVFDGDAEFEYVGDGAEVLSPTAVRVILVGFAEWTEPGVTMTVSEENGIAPEGGGASWVGVTDLALPFP